MFLAISGKKSSFMAWELIRQALDFCVGKNPHLKDRESVVNLLLEEDSWVHSTFRYALSRGICAFLGMHHQELEEVYLTGSTVEDTAGFTSDIDLIIKAENNEALADTLRRLDNDIMIYYRSLLKEQVKKMHRILSLEFIHKEKLERIKGQPFHPPLLIWHRGFSCN
jgi:hypothetical protein